MTLLRRMRSSLFPLLVSVIVGIAASNAWAQRSDPERPSAEAGERGVDLSSFVPFDSTSLLGSPDPLPPLVLERAFPKLRFVRPVALTHAGDGSGRIFVCDQIGVAYAFEDRDDVDDKAIFLDLRGRIRTEHFEEGLLGLAFHPEYRDNGEVFVYYTRREDPRASVVSRMRRSASNPETIDPNTEEVLLVIDQPYGNHNSGSIEFGPDGKLYIPLGDGGAANDPHRNGQNLGTLLGSILRIDIDRRGTGLPYAIPADNPFVGVAGARPEIWAYGLRNPWRMTFDRLTGDLWVGDVGQDLWEEIDVIVKGGNYGWNLREGHHPFAVRPARGAPAPAADPSASEAANDPLKFVAPVWEYPREDGKSITGGLVYRGEALPELYGTYLYGDFVTFNIWGLRYDGSKATSNELIARSSLPVTAFGESESGDVYITAFEAAAGVDVRRLDVGKVFQLNEGGLWKFARRASEEPTDRPAFPRRLSETGLFADLRALEPIRGAIPYDVNVPLWSDGAGKHRFIVLPRAGAVEFSEREAWQFPIGTVFVKTFTLPAGPGLADHRLETRLLVQSERGWDGYTYLWDDDLGDARLLDSALRRKYPVVEDGVVTEREWYFPSRSDCRACHTQVAGHVLGFETRQLHRIARHGDRDLHQISLLADLGVFRSPPEKPTTALESYPRWGDPGASTAELARAYLDVNCAVCHAPGGTGIAKADLRWDTALAEMHVVDEVPGQALYGTLLDTRVVAPGDPHRSELVLRMLARGPRRMPALATSRVDWEAVRVIGEWIEGLGRR
jgi:uncharacterized repeat protein (TIGR03806 family)